MRIGPALLGLGLGGLALGPALRPGFALRYDMVFVPDPPLRLGDGFPRAVPSDQVVALLSAVIPAEIVQKLILLGLFALAASGAAALAGDALRPPGTRPPGTRAPVAGLVVARFAAAAFYAWNAYLAQRLLIGQWALLLGYAGLPWAVRAAARGGAGRLAAALLPAAVGGFQAMLVSALAVLPVAARRGWAATASSAGVVAVLGLPWLVPALRADAVTDPAGVAAFAPRADGPFGTLGSLLTSGGIWNANAVVPGQDAPALAAARLALAVVATAGFVRLFRWREAGPRAGAAEPVPGTPSGAAPVAGWPVWAPGLAVAACAGLAIACAGAFAPGALRALVGWWAGFGPLRDGQVYIAPFVLAQAAGVAVAAAALRRAMPAPVAMAALAVPVLVLPTFALGAFGRLGAAGYPDEWRRVQAIVNGDPVPGALVSLPWSAYRAYSWNGGRVVLDPATKMFSRPVVWNDTLVVGLSGGGRISVAAETPRARRIGALLARHASGGGPPLTAAFAREGVRYVLAAGTDKNTFLSLLPGATVVWRGPELLLIRV